MGVAGEEPSEAGAKDRDRAIDLPGFADATQPRRRRTGRRAPQPPRPWWERSARPRARAPLLAAARRRGRPPHS
eukprot:scaffold3578_cov112-Isochrysis_galbana.AAC.8